VVLRRSIRIGRAPSRYRTAFRAAPGGLFERTGSPRLYRLTLPCFSPPAKIDANIGLPPHGPTERPRSASQVMSSTPHSYLTPHSHIRAILAHSVARFWCSKASQFRAKKSVTRCHDGRRSGHSGTLQETTGGTQTHTRRTGSKLGRLHRARQALVRFPESSTKYGGKTEITGGAQPLRCRQLSVSPEGFPRKKLSDTRQPKLRPAVHRRTIYCRQGVALPRLTRSYRWAGQACPPIDGHGAEDTAWCRRFPTV